MKIVPIKKKSSISAIALPSLMHKSCILCGEDDPVPIHTVEDAYEHAWDHWDAWQKEKNKVVEQLELF